MGLSPIENFSDLRAKFRLAQKATGKSLPQLILNAIRFRYGATGIGLSEFFGYKLYDSNLLSPSEIRSFASDAVSKQIWNKLNPQKYWGLVRDKIAFQLTMERMGFAQPELLGFYSKSGRCIPGINSMHNPQQIEEFLRQASVFPLFAKPNDSLRSLGAIGIKAYNSDSATVQLQNDTELSLSEMLAGFLEWDEYLFQASMSPHESLVDISGNALSTMRVVVLFTEQGPELFRVVWKIPVKTNMADNFWRPGNMVAHVTPANGNVYSIIQSADTGFVELKRGCPLGKRFLSSSPPFYSEAIDLVLKASRSYSMFKYQAWDIALTSAGPVALELNHNGDIEILQIGAATGILDEQFKNLLRQQNLNLQNPRRWFSFNR